MAEIAGGAVKALLGVIRDQAELLAHVEGDVQFIKEEMESMNSFLQHLARTTPRSGEHDEQVRTWMKQVRELAHDCSNCIDIYLRRSDPAVRRAKGGPLGYLWVPWFVIVTRTRAKLDVATQLRGLKDRARDVGKRRLRYGVEVPAKADPDRKSVTSTTEVASSSSSQAAATLAGDHESEDDDDPAASDDPRREVTFSELPIFEKCVKKLQDWLLHEEGQFRKFRSIAIAAPGKNEGERIYEQVLEDLDVMRMFMPNIFELPDPEKWFFLPEPIDVLGHILKTLSQRADESVEAFDEKEIDEKIKKIEEKIEKHLPEEPRVEPLGVLRNILRELLHDGDSTAGEDQTQDQETILEETAEKMKKYLESAGGKVSWRIGLDRPQYVVILRGLLPRPKQATPSTKEAAYKPGEEDHIVKNMKDITLNLKIQVHIPPELLPLPQEPQQDKSVDQMSPSESDCRDDQRIQETLKTIKDRLLIQETAGRIKEHLKGVKTLVVLPNVSGYKRLETENALKELGCGEMVVVVTTKYIQGAKEFCYPISLEPIIYSSIHYYHEKVINLTGRLVNDDDKYNVNIVREILEKCEPHEFCMKMLVHALFVNPKRSKGELDKLNDTLVFGGSEETNGKKLVKFSYNDLQRDYKTCLLYLAIFPLSSTETTERINRSSLVGRWVAEGQITREDWPSSVRQAERCFDALVDRCLVTPCDIGAAGKVKSCKVQKLVHDFITRKARKEHIMDTRLSQRLAHHFSILSDIQLRPTASITDFLEKPSSASSQLELIKVLDLEGCQHFKDSNQHYLRNVCTSLILLKFLSLRKTDITQLPKEINKLQQLEVLDIRQTRVHASATKHLMLLKLKRLLAGPIDQPSTPTRGGAVGASSTNGRFSTVRMPHRITRMRDMEVLSHVQASEHLELERIGKRLWQLRKLGVVIYDREAQLNSLLQGIKDLEESLRSLSIEVVKSPLGSEANTIANASKADIGQEIDPKLLLESLSISGTTVDWNGRLLPMFAKDVNKVLAKVTLQNTSLNQDNMEALGKLAALRGLRLLEVTLHNERKLTLKKSDGFQNLKYLVVKGGRITDISFQDEGTAPKLEKIVWSFGSTEIRSLSGTIYLCKLKKLVFEGDSIPDQVKQNMEEHRNYIDVQTQYS